MKFRTFVRLTASFAFSAVMAGGCMPDGSARSTLPQPPPQPITAPYPIAPTPNQRVTDIQRISASLAEDSRSLAGNDGPTHKKNIARVLNDLLGALPLLSDPASNPVLSQRLAIIQASHAQITAGSATLAIEPAIDTALRAATSALADVARAPGYEQPDLPPIVDKLSAQLAKLDVATDPNQHRVQVAASVDLMSTLVGRLSNILATRIDSQAASPVTRPS